ncbi:hypothetical protein DPMN_182513 [Dreissena polymorpha]|uniref:Peptidase C14 caspase domain-containing protein n=1 Tax=Dreissena polymorpha TaxID=45954 RepID=A0A9D4I2P1_DREPO|nr:hypothetical protein DPMN_182513 [Dreissena polymorpha]
MSAVDIVLFFSKFAKDNEEGLKASEYDKYVFVFLSTLKSADCIFVGNKDNKECLHMAKVYDEIKTSTFMAGKPKVFIIQADDEGMVKDIEVPQVPQADRKLPQDADRLIIMSTLPQILANIVDKDLGPLDLPTPNLESLIRAVQEKEQSLPISKQSQASFLIQAFVAVVKQCREDDKEVFTNTPYILKMVDERLDPFRARFPHIVFPLPLVTSTLTKPLKF